MWMQMQPMHLTTILIGTVVIFIIVVIIICYSDRRWELPAALGAGFHVGQVLGGLLCVLVVLHAYWFYLIASIALGMSSGELRDTRESKD